jgi:hypothetical protein
MKKLGLAILLLTLASHACATTYYLAPAAAGGSDSNDGTSAGTPWLTPNHAVNCGDVLLAATGTYAEGNFRLGNWGTVTCSSGNNVAWLKCATAFTCNITISNSGAHDALAPSQSYWGVQGWVVSVSAPSGNQCFNAYPPNSTTEIHHIIFANNIANGCGDGGLTVGAYSSTVGVDYVAIIGNIAYNGANDNANCYSGIDMVYPVNSDSLPGTHIYIAGNFTWGNVDPNPCSGGTPTDGHGISLDSLADANYTGQVLIDNNISVFNGGTGIQSFLNNGVVYAPVYIRHNTTYGNQTGSINANPCAEINLHQSLSSEVYGNLAQATSNTCHGSVSEYALGSANDNTTDIFHSNYIYSSAGDNVNSGSATVTNNTSGTNPNFFNPVMPSAPSCGSYSTVPACMATVIANFTPTTTAAKAYGYQTTSSTPIYDPLFPQWLCSVTNLPRGLITMGCPTAPASPAPPNALSLTIQ